MSKMRPGFHKSLALKRKDQGGEVEESELGKRIKKYLEENRTKKIIHMGKLTLNLGDMEKMVQSLRTTYPKYRIPSFKAQVMQW